MQVHPGVADVLTNRPPVRVRVNLRSSIGPICCWRHEHEVVWTVAAASKRSLTGHLRLYHPADVPPCGGTARLCPKCCCPSLISARGNLLPSLGPKVVPGLGLEVEWLSMSWKEWDFRPMRLASALDEAGCSTENVRVTLQSVFDDEQVHFCLAFSIILPALQNSLLSQPTASRHPLRN